MASDFDDSINLVANFEETISAIIELEVSTVKWLWCNSDLNIFYYKFLRKKSTEFWENVWWLRWSASSSFHLNWTEKPIVNPCRELRKSHNAKGVISLNIQSSNWSWIWITSTTNETTRDHQRERRRHRNPSMSLKVKFSYYFARANTLLLME